MPVLERRSAAASRDTSVEAKLHAIEGATVLSGPLPERSRPDPDGGASLAAGNSPAV